MSEKFNEVLQQMLESQKTGVVDVTAAAPESAGSVAIGSYNTLVDMKALLTVLARQSTVQKYRQHGKQLPNAENLDGQYFEYYSDSVHEIMSDMDRLMPYWRYTGNKTYNGSYSSSGITEVDQIEAEELFRGVLEDKSTYQWQEYVAPFQELIRKFANSLPGADLSGAKTMPSEGTILISTDVSMKPDPFNPSQLVRSPTLTMTFVRIVCERAEGRLNITTRCRALVAILNEGKVNRNRAKIEDMLQTAANSELGL